VVIGVLGAMGLTRLLKSLLFGVSTTDLPTYVSVVGILAGVALVASIVPAQRAAAVEPQHVLRGDN
jgi:putative ABC transport system permease protein